MGGAHKAGPLIVAQIEAVQSDLKRAEAKFRSAATALRHGSDWRVAMRFPVSGIAEEACAADLVVTSRSSGATATHERDAWPGGLILQAGRPVLVTPPGAAQLKARRIAIAWKDSRDARRAISDALPFLERADAVLLVEVCSDEDAASAQKRLADVAASARDQSHFQRYRCCPEFVERRAVFGGCRRAGRRPHRGRWLRPHSFAGVGLRWVHQGAARADYTGRDVQPLTAGVAHAVRIGAAHRPLGRASTEGS